MAGMTGRGAIPTDVEPAGETTPTLLVAVQVSTTAEAAAAGPALKATAGPWAGPVKVPPAMVQV